MTNLTLTTITAAVGGFGISAIAGYGIASRLDSLLIPVMFGFGTAAITVVGMNLGAGNVERARRTAWVNAIFVAALVEVLGLAVAIWPSAWMTWFTGDPQVLAAGARYLVMVGPVYGLGAINMELYFAGQAARKIGWPLAGTAFRLACAVAAMAWAKQGTPQLDAIYLLAAAGTVGACLLTAGGFAKVKWVATIR
jgi:Na+-driven multidrug efflux pump